jgi:hypothetical protein
MFIDDLTSALAEERIAELRRQPAVLAGRHGGE